MCQCKLDVLDEDSLQVEVRCKLMDEGLMNKGLMVMA